MITFPLEFPLYPGVSSIVWTEDNRVGLRESPNFKQQIYDWEADRWAFEASIDPLTRDEAAELEAFFSAMRGGIGTFMFGDASLALPRGTGAGTPRVKGAGQKGYTLEIDGCGLSQTVLKANDRFQLGVRLYKVTTDAETNSSGEVTLNIWPSLREHSDNEELSFTNAKGLFRLIGPVPNDIDRYRFHNLRFEAVEAL